MGVYRSTLGKIPSVSVDEGQYAFDMGIELADHPGLLREVLRFAPPAQAPVLLRLALDIAPEVRPSLSRHGELLGYCRALAGEGTLVQEMAGEIAKEVAND